jgi:hypothetical protein
MRLPDFLVVGAAKAGTVSLYHYLAQHPDIFMCPVNECNFFALETADLTSDYQGPVDRVLLDQHCTTTIEAYRTLFRGAASHQVVGECSPLYLFSHLAAARIQHHVPHAKIIAILRQPADRAFSTYQHLRRGGIEPIRDFRDAIRAEPARRAEGWGPSPFWYYAEMGFYVRQLQRYYALFGRRQVFVRLHEDLRQDAVGLLKDICAFVGVDPGFSADVSTRHNLGGTPRRAWLHRLMTRPGPTKQLLKAIVPTRARRRVRDRLAEWNTDKPRLDPALRTELTGTYREDIQALQDLIDRDLSHWL